MSLMAPQSLPEWLALLPSLAMALIGIAFFLVPGRAMRAAGFTANGRAAAEGRSSFGGLTVALAACAILFGQPALFAMIGLIWAVAAAGIFVQTVVERSYRNWPAVLLAALLALLARLTVELPEISLLTPAGSAQWMIALSAAVAMVAGLACFFFPQRMASLLSLAVESPERAGAAIRGCLAGLFLGMSLSVLLLGNPFLPLALSAAWLSAAAARIIALPVDDRSNWRTHLLFALAKAALGYLPLMALFG